jgi:hypothetical protein
MNWLIALPCQTCHHRIKTGACVIAAVEQKNTCRWVNRQVSGPRLLAQFQNFSGIESR